MLNVDKDKDCTLWKISNISRFSRPGEYGPHGSNGPPDGPDGPYGRADGPDGPDATHETLGPLLGVGWGNSECCGEIWEMHFIAESPEIGVFELDLKSMNRVFRCF